MAYSKTVWNNNTPPDISAENLNKMEQGIADAQFPDGGSTGQILSKTNDGTGWIDAPNSAVWGLIQGTLSDQTDLQAALDDVGNVDTVNGIQPDTNKNVEVDVELTKAEYDALPSSKLTDDVNYWIKDGTNLPQTSVISADGVQYTNSQTVKGALDSQASAISDLNNGLATNITIERKEITFGKCSPNVDYSKTLDVSKTGYSVLGIIGFQIAGTYGTHFHVSKADITNYTNALVSIRANSASTFTTDNTVVSFVVLYKQRRT